MPSKGRPKLPAKVKKMRGTYEKNKETPAGIEYELIAAVPDHPVTLINPAAVELWEMTCRNLISNDLLTEMSLVQVIRYCNSFQIYTSCMEHYPKLKFWEHGDHASRRIFQTIRDSAKDMKEFENMYGLNPFYADRIPKREKEEEANKNIDEWGLPM